MNDLKNKIIAIVEVVSIHDLQVLKQALLEMTIPGIGSMPIVVVAIDSQGGCIGAPTQPFPKSEPLVIKKLPELCEPFIPKLKQHKKPHQNRYAKRATLNSRW